MRKLIVNQRLPVRMMPHKNIKIFRTRQTLQLVENGERVNSNERVDIRKGCDGEQETRFYIFMPVPMCLCGHVWVHVCTHMCLQVCVCLCVSVKLYVAVFRRCNFEYKGSTVFSLINYVP